MSKKLNLISAMTVERVIGADNGLPWHLPADLKHFKKTTTGQTVIMGRKTFDSIKKALPNRKNVVLTRDPNFHADGVVVCHTWEEVFKNVDDGAFVVGGSEIYRQSLPYIDRMYLTILYQRFPGDALFPEVDLQKDFVLEEKSEMFQEPFPYQFQTWRRR